jgi:hypothetical protein
VTQVTYFTSSSFEQLFGPSSSCYFFNSKELMQYATAIYNPSPRLVTNITTTSHTTATATATTEGEVGNRNDDANHTNRTDDGNKRGRRCMQRRSNTTELLIESLNIRKNSSATMELELSTIESK